jgi:hypothetical protein
MKKNTLSTIREFIKTRAEEFPPACSFLRYILENSEHEEMGPEVEKYIMDFIKDPQKEGGEWHPLQWTEVMIEGIRYIQSGMLYFNEYSDDSRKECQEIANWICN